MIARTIQPGDWVDLFGEWREVVEIERNAHPDHAGIVRTVTMMFLGWVTLTVSADADLPVRPWCMGDRNEDLRTEGTRDYQDGEPDPSREELLQMLSSIDAKLCAMLARDVAPTTDEIVAAIRELG
jgi:hypothetical protein